MSKTYKHQRGQFQQVKGASTRRMTAREARALDRVIHEANVPYITNVIFGK